MEAREMYTLADTIYDQLKETPQTWVSGHDLMAKYNVDLETLVNAMNRLVYAYAVCALWDSGRVKYRTRY